LLAFDRRTSKQALIEGWVNEQLAQPVAADALPLPLRRRSSA
jgi:hypothetical protein